MKTDTSEKGLETLITRHLTGEDGLLSGVGDTSAEATPHTKTSGSSWIAGRAAS